MSWLEKLLPAKIQHTEPSERRQVPEGLWTKCPSCETVLYKTDLEQNQNVCPTCSHHLRMGAFMEYPHILAADHGGDGLVAVGHGANHCGVGRVVPDVVLAQGDVAGDEGPFEARTEPAPGTPVEIDGLAGGHSFLPFTDVVSFCPSSSSRQTTSRSRFLFHDSALGARCKK